MLLHLYFQSKNNKIKHHIHEIQSDQNILNFVNEINLNNFKLVHTYLNEFCYSQQCLYAAVTDRIIEHR